RAGQKSGRGIEGARLGSVDSATSEGERGLIVQGSRRRDKGRGKREENAGALSAGHGSSRSGQAGSGDSGSVAARARRDARGNRERTYRRSLLGIGVGWR